MRALRIAALGGIAYTAWRFLRDMHASPHAAFAEGQPEGDAAVRDAGPEAMRDAPRRPWTEVDEDSDESFPASDPPGNY